MTRAFILSVLLLPATGLSEGDCQDDFHGCKDDCTIEFGGSVRIEARKKYEKCVKKCSKLARRCTERVMETKAHGLEPGALDGTPTSADVDREGLPTRPGSAKKGKGKKSPEDVETGENGKSKAPLSDDEVPKSSRTTLKVEEPKTPAPAPGTPPPAAPSKPTPRVEEELRDDAPKVQSVEPKKDKKPDEPAKKKEEDHDDLRYY
jgi:hypothetical protein